MGHPFETAVQDGAGGYRADCTGCAIVLGPYETREGVIDAMILGAVVRRGGRHKRREATGPGVVWRLFEDMGTGVKRAINNAGTYFEARTEQHRLIEFTSGEDGAA